MSRDGESITHFVTVVIPRVLLRPHASKCFRLIWAGPWFTARRNFLLQSQPVQTPTLFDL
jgi:hypothetical protein